MCGLSFVSIAIGENKTPLGKCEAPKSFWVNFLSSCPERTKLDDRSKKKESSLGEAG